MEGIIILVILYFLFKKVTQRVKEIGSKTGAAKPNVSTGAHIQAVREPQAKHHKPVSENPPNAPLMTPQLRADGLYQPIKPMITLGDNRSTYTGSLGAVSTEGSASPAVAASGEGTAIPTVTANLQGSVATEGAVSEEGDKTFPDSLLNSGNHAYAIGEEDQVCEVLPAEWSRDAFVQGIVMKEILDRPGRRGYSHG